MNFKSCKNLQLSPVIALFLSIGVLLSTDTLADVSQAQLAAERNARITADTTLTTNLAAEQNARIAADTAETNARTAADTAEVAARQQAIQSAINALQAQLNAIALPPPVSGTRPKAGLSLKLCPNNNTPQWDHCPLAIGDTGPAGGIVFYLTDTTGQHGLEVSPVDQGIARWGCEGTTITGADSHTVGSGAQNTLDILAGCKEAGIAAKLASDYTLNGYNDWFLPSIDELTVMCRNIGPGAAAPLTNAGKFSVNAYWSSSEEFFVASWLQVFDLSATTYILGKNDNGSVRAVRAF